MKSYFTDSFGFIKILQGSVNVDCSFSGKGSLIFIGSLGKGMVWTDTNP